MEKLIEFIDTSENGRGWMRELQAYERYVYATNGHIVVRKLGELHLPPVALQEQSHVKHILDKMDIVPVTSITVKCEELKAALESFKIQPAKKKCPECKGFGEVEWTYEEDNGSIHTMEDECPCCGGSGDFGVAGDVLTYDQNDHYRPLTERLNPKYIEKLVDLGDSIVFNELKECKHVTGKVGEYEFLICPLSDGSKVDAGHEIKIQNKSHD